MDQDSSTALRVDSGADELERANAALRDAEQRLHSVFEAIEQALAIVETIFDAEGRPVDARVVEANPSFVRLTGVDAPAGLRVRTDIPALGQQSCLDLLAEAANEGRCTRFEKYVEAWGKWFEVSACAVDDPGLHRIAVSMYDITGCKMRELAARQTERRQAFMLSLSDALRPLESPSEIQATAARLLCEELGAAAAMYVEIENQADGDYYVARQHHSAVEFQGRGEQRLRSDRFGSLLHADFVAGRTVVVHDTESDARLGEREREEFRAARTRACVTVPLVKGGSLVSVITAVEERPRAWTAEDVELVEATAERTWAAVLSARAEESSRQSEARLRLALDASTMGTFVWHAPRNVTEADERVLALFGLPASASFNVAEPPEVLLHADDYERYLDAVRRAADPKGAGTLREDVRVVHADGSIHWLAITAQMLFEGTPPQAGRLVGMVADISERKLTEEVLREREERLRETDRNKDEFLAVLAHELRNPLAPIRTGLELLRVSTGSPETTERIRNMMERQVGHMVRLIDDLLDVSRLTFGTIHLRREPTDLARLVNTAIEANRKAIDDAQITLRVELPAEPVVLDVDATRFVQVVSNLLNNAVKFTEARGWIQVAVAVGADVSVVVSDSGLGISREMLPRVFDLFTRGAGDTERGQKGLGIGLALARRLVEMHGGSLDAFSEGPGRGSTFTIRLPLDIVVPDEAPEEEPVARDANVKRRVVVVDDNRDSADTTAMFLSTLGCDAHVAYAGESGLRLVLELRPQLVLLDIGMPGMDGYETCRRIRNALGYDIVVVAMTGWGQERDKQRAKSAGFDAHLTKPIDPAVLRKLLEDLETSRFSKAHSAA